MDQFSDFRELLPRLAIETVFDVGANVGQSTRAFRRAWPSAKVYAFEPVNETFETMRSSVADDPSVRCFRIALGDKPSSAIMAVSEKSLTNKIVTSAWESVDGQAVSVDTGERFCAAEGIDRINFLKIDTEGYDLKVCRGFERLLLSSRIDLVQVEAGLHPESTRHVPLQAFKDYLEPMGYWIFRLYDQAGNSFARRCNAVFISSLQRELHRKAADANEADEAAEEQSAEIEPQVPAFGGTTARYLGFRQRRSAATGNKNAYWWNRDPSTGESVEAEPRKLNCSPQGNRAADFLSAAAEMGRFLKRCSEMRIFTRQFMFAHCIVLFVLSRENAGLPLKILRRHAGLPIRQAEELIEELQEAAVVSVKDDLIAITAEGRVRLAELERQLLPYLEAGADETVQLQSLTRQIVAASRVLATPPPGKQVSSSTKSSPQSSPARMAGSVRSIFARFSVIGRTKASRVK